VKHGVSVSILKMETTLLVKPSNRLYRRLNHSCPWGFSLPDVFVLNEPNPAIGIKPS